jgi:tetratricopeptide (TPR) repeat protein
MSDRRSLAIWTALGAGFVALALVLVWPAIDGVFLSDDYLYVVNDPYVHGLSWENVKAILDPYGSPTVYSLNYAPVHLLLHATQWQLVGDHTRLYHVTNAVAHGLTSLLLVLFFVRAGIPRLAAILGALIFLVHPANVETVAWIFQLKTIVALALSLGALLLHERRPTWALLLFTLALLTKITALGVLPVVALQAWVRSRHQPASPPHWRWLVGWAVAAVLVSIPEMAAFERQSDVRLVLGADPVVHARTIFAIAARYLWMAATGRGVATFHEPPVAESWLDPWWLAGLAALIAIGARSLWTLLHDDEEVCLWAFAAAAFAPVSQIFVFIFPMGDRYLYPILPGLIGAVLLALRPAFEALAARVGAEPLRRVTVMAALGAAAWLASVSHARAPVFADDMSMLMDAAKAYPDGMMASILRGHQAARRGDAESAARAFERAVDLGFSDLQALLSHPELRWMNSTPVFRQRVLVKLANLNIQRLSQVKDPDQSELLVLARAYEIRGDLDLALAALERAQDARGGFDDEVRLRLLDLRARHRLGAAERPPGDADADAEGPPRDADASANR